MYDCSQPYGRQHSGFPVLHYLLEFVQTHVYWVNDVTQPSHPLSSPSPPALNLSQHQSLFQWVKSFASGGQSIGISASASLLPVNIQGWFPLGWTGLISLLSKVFSRVFSNTTGQRHQFFSSLPSSWSNSHICAWLLSLHGAPTGSQFMVILIPNCSSITDKLAIDACSRYSMTYFKISY